MYPMLRLEDSARREWLETNGLGSYASSTLAGMNTRRYHGLLVAGGRVLLAKIEESLLVGSRRYELSTNRYPGAVHPRGYTWLREFRLDPFPVWVFECEGTLLEKSVFMVYGEDTTVVQYRASEACEMELRPLIAFRDYHALTHENGALRAEGEMAPGSAAVAPYEGLPALHVAHAGGGGDGRGTLHGNFAHPPRPWRRTKACRRCMWHTPAGAWTRGAAGMATSNTTAGGSAAWIFRKICSSRSP